MKLKSERGFTLIELAMVLIIFGMVTTIVMTAFMMYNLQQNEERTNEAFEVSESGILAFHARFGRYPCPASPTAARGTANYGREQIDGTGQCTATLGVQAADSGLDQDNDGNPDLVFIGSVPFDSMLDPDNNNATNDGIRDVPLRDGLTYDGFGRRLTYAVTDNLTRVVDYNDFFGAIQIVDENNNTLIDENEDTNGDGLLTAGEDDNNNGILDRGNYAHVALISHGDNGRGATTATGALVEACPAFVPLPGGGITATNVSEIENCDAAGSLDGTFLSGLRYESDHSYNDDRVKFFINEAAGLWSYVPGSSNQIQNTNGGRVGINQPDPQEMLDINGAIRSFVTRSDDYCDTGGLDCMTANLLGGDVATMQCPPGNVVTSIGNNSVNCTPAFTGTFIPRACPANCYASGFQRLASGDTQMVCRNTSTLAICP